MTLTTPYQASFYVGDGETKAFSFVFEELSDNFVKVIVSHIDGTTSIPTYTVDLDLKQVVFGDETPAPTADDIVCIYRETPTIQDTPFKTLEGYNAKALENILSKIVAMIQEIKSNYFSTQVLQGDPWQLDLLKSADDGATVNIDYVAKKLVKGLYFQISNGNLQVSADGSSYITMPKSADIVEFRQVQTVLEDLTVQYRLQYRIGNEWFNAESNAEATADEAKQIAEEARDIASDAKDIAQDASDKVDGFDDRITQAEQDASDAKDIAQDASDAVSAHITDTNNPHSVTKAQIGLGNCDNTADLDKPISTATQTALDTKATPADITSAISTHNADSSAHSSIISPIQEVIPTAATSSNQLADKNFVNSSIATSTATFRGTYNSLAELEAQTADENDYGFVVSTDAAGNTIYNRYKYTTATTPASWVFEYALNNSSFTATQWDAINSGANTTNIGQIATNTSAISSHTGNTNNPHSVTKAQVGLGNVDNTSDLDKPISTATQTALDGKQATISDLATIRSNAQAGKAASDTIATYGDIVTHDVTEFATATQGAKADTALQTGDNVSELVNDAGYLVNSDLANFVTKNTAQTISGLKTFSADITLSGTTSIKNTTNGVSYTMLYRDASGIHVGTSTQALLLAGSGTRPTFNGNNVAMLSDVPTAVSQLTNDTGFITNAVNDLQNYTLTSDLATVATSGSYNDLSNKPTIPAAQVNSDWNANSGVAQILNKPTLGTAAAADTTDFATATQGGKADTAVQPGDLATVATSGSYTDLSNTPTIPTTLAGLTGDVSISSPSGGEHLVYDAVTSKWKNTPSAATVSWGGIGGTLSNQTDLQNALDAKADTSLSNITSAGKAVCANMPMPSSTKTALTIGASGTSYTAPADGYFDIRLNLNTGGYISVAFSGTSYTQLVNASWQAPALIPVAKGEVIRLDYANRIPASYEHMNFIYAKGSI